MKRCLVVLSLFALLSPAWAQHEHRQHVMVTRQSAEARLEVRDDPAAQVLTVRVGPLNLPAHASHMAVAQAPVFYLSVPFEGWITAYHPRLVDDSGHVLPGRLLHHVAFYNTARLDFVCPNKREHIFGAGGEMNDWPALPGFGYRVHQGDRIRVGTMFHNPTETGHPRTWLEVKIEYRSVGKGEPLKSVYPTWLDVQECGDSGYDLAPGRNVSTGEIKLAYSGVLLGVGGHMHDYGQQLELLDLTRNHEVANLKSRLDPSGRILSMPVVYFLDQGGYKLHQGDVLRVTATYENSTGKAIPEGAMGIVVGYFLPENDAQLAALGGESGKQ